MATQKTKNESVSVRFNGFDGIDGIAAHSGGASVSDMVNFRILGDGSAEKRCGYRKLADFADKPETYWCGSYGGELRLYFVIKGMVGKYRFSTGETGAIGKPSGFDMTSPKIFMLNGRLYLFAAGGFVYISPQDKFTKVSGYIPHVGKDWSNDLIGEINEPLNILNRRARFTYTVSDEPSIFFRVLYPVKTIDRVEVNGNIIDSSKYYFDSLYNSVNISNINGGDRVEIAVTYDLEQSSSLSALYSSSRAEVFGGMANNRVFIWNDEGDGSVFSSGYISPAEEADCNRIYTGITKNFLYFPEGYEFKVGSGDSPLKAVTRHYDRLLFFTDRDVWMADNETCALERIPTMNINSKIGCQTARGVAMAGNDPVSVGNGRIYRWTSETDRLSECNAYCISEPISHLLEKSFFENAKVVATKGRPELFFYDPTSTDGVMWVYQWERKVWYRFDGVPADAVFDADGTVCFIKDNRLYCFDEESYYDDVDEGSSYIKARIESGILELDTEKRRRLKSICVRGDAIRRVKVTITPEGLSPVVFQPNEIGIWHKIIKKRLTSGRFKIMRLKLENEYDERMVVHGLEITAK